VYVATFNAFGANPTPVPAPEMYTALQQGVVSAMEGTTETAVTYGIAELAKNCLETHHIYNETTIVVNRDAFAELPEDLRKILKECAAEMMVWNRQESSTAGDRYKQQMIGMNVKFVPIDIAKAKAMVADVYQEYIGGDATRQEIFDLLMEAQK
jgi:TRAP-type C4-dicarboxylate transport system substrate-binding protein